MDSSPPGSSLGRYGGRKGFCVLGFQLGQYFFAIVVSYDIGLLAWVLVLVPTALVRTLHPRFVRPEPPSP